jgi:putative PIN family toxin of toxin-antitoxin system
MKRIVLDTNALVSAFLSPFGKCSRILNLVLNGDMTAVLDAGVMAEYEDVLARPRLRINAARRGTVLGFLKTVGEFVVAAPQRAVFADEDDKVFYEVFIGAGADFLVSGNKRHFPSDPRIVTPAEFLSRL